MVTCKITYSQPIVGFECRGEAVVLNTMDSLFKGKHIGSVLFRLAVHPQWLLVRQGYQCPATGWTLETRNLIQGAYQSLGYEVA
jgi:hypothetical protein